MQGYEYRAVPAPRRGVKARGLKGEEARFAAAIEGEMNRMGADGWDYVRSDTLPSEERQGWFGGRQTVFRTLLVFRRARAADMAQAPALLPNAGPAAGPMPPVALAPAPVPAPPPDEPAAAPPVVTAPGFLAPRAPPPPSPVPPSPVPSSPLPTIRAQRGASGGGGAEAPVFRSVGRREPPLAAE